VVMLAATNSAGMLETLLAVCDAGAIVSPINHRWSPAELAAAMQLVRPCAVIVDVACWELVQQALGRQSVGLQVGMRPKVVLLGGEEEGRGGHGGSFAVSNGGVDGTTSGTINRGADLLSTEGLIHAGCCALNMSKSSVGGSSCSGCSRCFEQTAGTGTDSTVVGGAEGAWGRPGRAAEAEVATADIQCSSSSRNRVPLQLKSPASGAAVICFTSGTTGQ